MTQDSCTPSESLLCSLFRIRFRRVRFSSPRVSLSSSLCSTARTSIATLHQILLLLYCISSLISSRQHTSPNPLPPEQTLHSSKTRREGSIRPSTCWSFGWRCWQRQSQVRQSVCVSSSERTEGDRKDSLDERSNESSRFRLLFVVVLRRSAGDSFEGEAS